MKKLNLTEKEIAHDIKRSFGIQKRLTKSQYKKWSVSAVLAGVALGVLEWVFFDAVIWVLLGILVLLLAAAVIVPIWTLVKKRTFCMSDYEVSEDVLEHKTEEHYNFKNGRHRPAGVPYIEQIDNYDLHFACGKAYRIPNTNYTWTVEWQSAGAYIYENAHRGDKFIVVTHKKTGEIAVVYPTSLFVYKGETA